MFRFFFLSFVLGRETAEVGTFLQCGNHCLEAGRRKAKTPLFSLMDIFHIEAGLKYFPFVVQYY
jgi:hypothetical protein